MKDNEKEIPLMRSLSKELEVDKLSLKKFTYIGEGAQDFLPENKDFVLGKHKSVTQMNRCRRPWESVVISWNGDVLPCCGDLSFRFKFGNAFEDGNFVRIWNSQQFINFRRKAFQDINSIKMCKSCPSTDFTTDMFVQ